MAHNAKGSNQVKTGDKSRLTASPKVMRVDVNKGKAGGGASGTNSAESRSANFKFPGKLT